MIRDEPTQSTTGTWGLVSGHPRPRASVGPQAAGPRPAAGTRAPQRGWLAPQGACLAPCDCSPQVRLGRLRPPFFRLRHPPCCRSACAHCHGSCPSTPQLLQAHSKARPCTGSSSTIRAQLCGGRRASVVAILGPPLLADLYFHLSCFYQRVECSPAQLARPSGPPCRQQLPDVVQTIVPRGADGDVAEHRWSGAQGVHAAKGTRLCRRGRGERAICPAATLAT